MPEKSEISYQQPSEPSHLDNAETEGQPTDDKAAVDQAIQQQLSGKETEQSRVTKAITWLFEQIKRELKDAIAEAREKAEQEGSGEKSKIPSGPIESWTEDDLWKVIKRIGYGKVVPRSMNDWSGATKGIGIDYLARDFSDSPDEKIAALEKIVKMQLPGYNRASMSVGEFLANPRLYLEQVEGVTGRFHPKIESTHTERRQFEMDLNQGEVISWVEKMRKKYPKDFGDDALLILREYMKNDFGGNITIHPDGSIAMEIGRGNHSELAYTGVQPLISIDSDSFTGFGRRVYPLGQESAGDLDFWEKQMKRTNYKIGRAKGFNIAIWKLTKRALEKQQPLTQEEEELLKNIPQELLGYYIPVKATDDLDFEADRFTSHAGKRPAGYYEFILHRLPGGLKPVFIDYNDKANVYANDGMNTDAISMAVQRERQRTAKAKAEQLQKELGLSRAPEVY